MTGYRCRCGAGIFYNNVKQTSVKCDRCGEQYTVTKDGSLQQLPPIENFNLDKSLKL